MFLKVKFSITDACEGTCEFCYRGSILGKTFLEVNVIKRAIKEAKKAGVKLIHFSGGDPTLHPEFNDLVDYTFLSNIPLKLSVNSSSVALQQIYKYYERGLYELALSIDSIVPEKNDGIRGMRGDFEKTSQILKHLGGKGEKIVVTFLITRESIDEVLELSSILQQGQRIKLKLQMVETTLITKNNHTNPEYPDIDKLSWLYNNAIPILQSKFGSNRIIPIPTPFDKWRVDPKLLKRWAQGFFGPDARMPSKCTYMLHNPHIKEDGKVYPCCGVASERILGNLYLESLVEIYRGHLEKHKDQRKVPYRSCFNCVFYSYYNSNAKF